MNKVELIGRTTRDIEVRYTASTQTAVTRFNLAVNSRKKDEADFINCIAWGKTAEVMEKYVHKGDRVGIVGRIETGNYKDKDGKTVYTTDVVVEELDFLENKKAELTTEPNEYEFEAIDEDIPF